MSAISKAAKAAVAMVMGDDVQRERAALASITASHDAAKRELAAAEQKKAEAHGRLDASVRTGGGEAPKIAREIADIEAAIRSKVIETEALARAVSEQKTVLERVKAEADAKEIERLIAVAMEASRKAEASVEAKLRELRDVIVEADQLFWPAYEAAHTAKAQIPWDMSIDLGRPCKTLNDEVKLTNGPHWRGDFVLLIPKG